MKKLLLGAVILCAMVSLGCSAYVLRESISSCPTTDAVRLSTAEAQYNKADDDRDYENFYGRLRVSAVGIDVALYDDYEQTVCDRWDSACCFTMYGYYGRIIGDHHNQEFAGLTDVTAGMTAVIRLADGTAVELECVEVFDGHNTGTAITDNRYHDVMGKYDYLTYTCINGYKNIRVCQWQVIEK